ncbi:MAG: glycosyltransferase family 9 protein, partial [Patescibacteria group bacterium]
IFKNIILLALCYLKSIVSGRADREIKNPQKVLVIQSAKLGDMVCTTPVFHAIKKKYPLSRVYVLGNQVNQYLLADNPDVDGYIVSKNDTFKLVEELKKERFDFACLAVPNLAGLAAAYLSGIPLICAPRIVSGYSPYSTKSFRWVARLVVTRGYGVEKYAPGEYLKVLEPIGIHTQETKKYLGYSSSAQEKIRKFFLNQNINSESDFIIGLSPAVGNKIKLWSPSKFASLVDYIQDRYQAKIVIIGTETDAPLVAEMISFLGKKNQVTDAVGKFNLDELKALVSQMSMFIGVDTGPIYIAEAFEVPTVDIIGPVDENVQPPRGEFNRIVKVERNKAEIYILNAKDYDFAEAKRQIDEISVEMVVKEFENLVRAINLTDYKKKILPLQ